MKEVKIEFSMDGPKLFLNGEETPVEKLDHMQLISVAMVMMVNQSFHERLKARMEAVVGDLKNPREEN